MASDFELQVLAELSDIKSSSAATAQQVASLEERLFNGGSGAVHSLQNAIEEMKAEKIRDDRWEHLHNILHYSLAPLLVTAHAVARHPRAGYLRLRALPRKFSFLARGSGVFSDCSRTR